MQHFGDPVLSKPVLEMKLDWILSLNEHFSLLLVDHSRVKLTLSTTKNDTDYINANFIKVNEQSPRKERII